MGLRAKILGFDPSEVQRLRDQVEDLTSQLRDLQGKLDKLESTTRKVELLEEKLRVLDLVSENVKENRLWLREILKDIEDLRLELEALKLKSVADSSAKEKPSELELEAKVYELIQKGYHSPTQLAGILGISKEKLYRILKRLQEARLITTKGKGKRKKYVPKIEVEEE